MTLQHVSISEEAIARFRENAKCPAITEAWIYREQDELGKVVLMLNFKNAESFNEAWNQRKILMLSCQELALGQQIAMTVRGYRYRSFHPPAGFERQSSSLTPDPLEVPLQKRWILTCELKRELLSELVIGFWKKIKSDLPQYQTGSQF
jgi:hypothetical protein